MTKSKNAIIIYRPSSTTFNQRKWVSFPRNPKCFARRYDSFSKLLFIDCSVLSINHIQLGKCSFISIQTVYMESKNWVNYWKDLPIDGNGIGEYIKDKEEEIMQDRDTSKGSIEFAMNGFDIVF